MNTSQLTTQAPLIQGGNWMFCHTAASMCVSETATHNVRHTVTLFCHIAASMFVSETGTHNVWHTVTLLLLLLIY